MHIGGKHYSTWPVGFGRLVICDTNARSLSVAWSCWCTGHMRNLLACQAARRSDGCARRRVGLDQSLPFKIANLSCWFPHSEPSSRSFNLSPSRRIFLLSMRLAPARRVTRVHTS